MTRAHPPASAPQSPTPHPGSDDWRWTAVQKRERHADGAFFYAVQTTGVFCRPSCAARTPRRENVVFFETPQAAVAAGFRPCKRCTPDAAAPHERRNEQVATLCRWLEESDEIPSLSALAERLGLSVFHTQRMFKAVTGVTPRAYALSCRAQRLQNALGASASVTEAAYAAGYGSSGRFYSEAPGVLGMTPGQYRRGAPDLVLSFGTAPCALGVVLVAATTRGICAILLGDSPEELLEDLKQRFPKARLSPGDEAFDKLLRAAVQLVEQPEAAASLPLDIQGTAFQRRVWQALREIPAGQTLTYTELAHSLGDPQAVRAVASACAANPVAVAVPCHRVVRADGSLAGYRWGLPRKRALLDREAEKNQELGPSGPARPNE